MRHKLLVRKWGNRLLFAKKKKKTRCQGVLFEPNPPQHVIGRAAHQFREGRLVARLALVARAALVLGGAMRSPPLRPLSGFGWPVRLVWSPVLWIWI